MAASRFDQVELGDDLPELQPDVSLAKIARFAQTTQMQANRFTDHEKARAEGLPGAIVPVPDRVGVREPFGVDHVVEKEPREEAAYRSVAVQPAQPFELSGIAGMRELRTVSVIVHAAQAEVFSGTGWGVAGG